MEASCREYFFFPAGSLEKVEGRRCQPEVGDLVMMLFGTTAHCLVRAKLYVVVEVYDNCTFKVVTGLAGQLEDIYDRHLCLDASLADVLDSTIDIHSYEDIVIQRIAR